MYNVKLSDGELFEVSEKQYADSNWESVMNDNKVLFVLFGKRTINKHRINEIIPIIEV